MRQSYHKNGTCVTPVHEWICFHCFYFPKFVWLLCKSEFFFMHLFFHKICVTPMKESFYTMTWVGDSGRNEIRYARYHLLHSLKIQKIYGHEFRDIYVQEFGCSDKFHWNCSNTPKIHLIEKLRFLCISRYKFKWRFWFNMSWYRGIQNFGIWWTSGGWYFQWSLWYQRVVTFQGLPEWCAAVWSASNDKITGLFWERAPTKRLYSAKKTHNFIDPTVISESRLGGEDI